MEAEPKKPSVLVYAPAPRWNFEIPKTMAQVYVACAHRLHIDVESDEALYLACEAGDRFWCPRWRRKR